MKRLILVAVLLTLAFVSWHHDHTNRRAKADDPAAANLAAAVPVEEDMHEFMEYVFEPAYKRLKAAIAAEPKDKAAWKPIKADSLLWAEGANLLLNRASGDDAAEWNLLSVTVRDAGGQLYQTAKNNSYAAARKSYEDMLTSCNRCHKKFADGEHQLAP